MNEMHIAFLESNNSGSGYEAIRAAKERGCRVTFVTRNWDFYFRPGQLKLDASLVDAVVRCETNDPDAVVAALEPYADDLTTLISVGEWHMLSGAAAAAKLGFLGQDLDSVRAAREKSLTRARCEAAGVPIPRFRRATTPDEAADAGVGFPCVVKPVDECASRGVKLCASADEVRAHTREVLAETHNEREQEKVRAVVVEEYLDGAEVSVESFTFGGRTDVVMVTQKVLGPEPYFCELGHAVPAPLDAGDEQACRETAVAALAAIGYTFGAAHVELRLTTEGPKLVEINCRLGGDRITHLVKLATGLEMPAVLIDMYLGTPPPTPPPASQGAAIVFLPSVAGTVTGVEGIDAARSSRGVVDVSLQVKPGDVVSAASNNDNRFGSVVAIGSDGAEALANARAGASAVSVAVA